MNEAETGGSGNGPGLKRALGLWDLVLFNVVAIVGLRWLSTAAQMGPMSLALWVLALVVFFVPSGLAVMELSSRIPGEGGIYLWAKRSLGDVHGHMAGWSYWVSNLVYVPSYLIFVAGVFLFLGGNEWLGLGESRVYNTAFTLAVLWIALGWNIVGLERGKWVQNVGAIGTWIVAALLIVFGVYAWLRFGSATSFSDAPLLPDLRQLPTLAFFATMAFGFAGLELAPVMGDEIKEPRRIIPRALLISGVFIAGVYVGGTAVLLVAIPTEQISVVTGVPQALAAVGDRVGISGLSRIGALLITIGGLGGVGAWVTATARLPFVAGVDRTLPESLGRIHPRWGTPHVALIVQGALATVLLLMAVAGSTIEEAYIVLLDMTIILYFIPFLYLFSALLILRSRKSDDEPGIVRVPGGLPATVLVGGLGLLATGVSLVLATVPPEGTERPGLFVLKVVGGCAVILGVGLVFYLRGGRSDAQESQEPVGRA